MLAAAVLILLLVLIALGMPIAFALGVTGALGVLSQIGFTPMLGVLQTTPYRTAAHFLLSTVPLFILMAELLARGSVVRDLYRLAYLCLGHIRGGLAMAAIAANVGFAVLSGSSTAAAAAMSRISMPEMRRYGYDESFALGVIAIGGTLSIMIPPSLALILFGVLTETSIGKLFLAGIIPGLITVAGYLIVIQILVRRRPEIAPATERFPMKARMEALPRVWPALVLVFLVLGGIYSLAAVGFSLIFGVIGIVNLTHGIFVIAGAYMAMALFAAAGIDPLLAIPVIGAVLFAVGYAYQRTIIDWAISRASVEASLVVTFGMAMVFRNLLQLWFGPDVQTITPSYSFDSVAIGPIRVDMVRLAALGASMALLTGLTLMLARTHFGRAMRAVAQQPLAASLSGLNVRRIHGLTFGVSAALAGASGAIIGIVQPFSASSEVAWTLNAFIVVVLGGIGSPAGALAGGLVLGLINAYTATYVSPALTQAMMFLVLVLMLLLRPQGILGAAYGESR